VEPSFDVCFPRWWQKVCEVGCGHWWWKGRRGCEVMVLLSMMVVLALHSSALSTCKSAPRELPTRPKDGRGT
jgi:hypothetical protein